jgi:hypothetical protein
VYIVVVKGDAITTAPEVVDKPVAGDQVKLSALVALMAIVPPLHTATEGPIDTASIGYTVMLLVALFTQPPALVKL